jgi:hypothetical protein
VSGIRTQNVHDNMFPKNTWAVASSLKLKAPYFSEIIIFI